MPTQPSDGPTTAISRGPIMSTSQLRAEASLAETYVEEFARLVKIIGDWAKGLPERYAKAPFGTTGLTTAITHLVEAKLQGPALVEALKEIHTALDEADGLGEDVDAQQADGNVEAFTPGG